MLEPRRPGGTIDDVIACVCGSRNERRRPTAPYPPGHPRRARLRRLLQDLGAASVRVTFESRGGRYRLLGYRTAPVRHRLDERATQELRAFAIAQIRQALPGGPDQDGKRGRFSWALGQDRGEIGY